MDLYKLNPTFHNYVEYWWLYLETLMKDCRRAKRRPVLIALSRKMPRFVEWFRDTYADEYNTGANVGLLDDVEITTEIAIPFIFGSQDCSDCEFIILDDVIIRGTTLTLTSNLLYALTGRMPRVSCIAMRENVGVRPMVPPEDFERIPVLSQRKIDIFADQISSIVQESQLPVDMEFPIFKIYPESGVDSSEEVFSDIEWSMRDFFRDRCYDIGSDHDRMSVDFSIPMTAGYDTDFSKVRFFLNRKSNEVTFEVFSPLIISHRILTSRDYSPFSETLASQDPDSLIRNLWEMTTGNIRRNFEFVVDPVDLEVPPFMLRQEVSRSLAVWANYIFSLITYILNRNLIIPEEYRSLVKLSLKDLSLLIGYGLMDTVGTLIKEILDAGAVVLSVREKNTEVAWNLCPKYLEEAVEANKIASLLGGGSPEGVAEGIFKFMHYSNPKRAGLSPHVFEWRHSTLGETYYSLQDALYPLYTGKGYIKDLRGWVDMQIDAGRIIPKYNIVEDDKGEAYWRRFFHAGIRKF